jgi:predicted transcriptional regulator
MNAGLTQAELGRRASTTQSVIARLEAAGANPRLATLDKVIAATGHSLTLELGSSEGIDESLIVESLKASPSERLRQFESFYESARRIGGKAFQAVGS